MTRRVRLQNLVERSQSGDRTAFDELVEQCANRLERLICFHVGSELQQKLEVDDLVQETWTEVWRQIRTFRWQNEKAFWGWLDTLARHVIYDQVRRFRARKRAGRREISLQQGLRRSDAELGELIDVLKATTVSPSRALRRQQRFDRLKETLRRLRPDHRQVIMLTRVKGLSVKETARQMGRSEPAVSMLLLRALRKLKEIFEDTESLHLPGRSLEEEDHDG